MKQVGKAIDSVPVLDLHTVREAVPGDDASIRALLRRSPMPGDIRMAFTREPSFFASLEVEGKAGRAAVAEALDGAIRGLIVRNEKEAWVNGNPMPLGYLSGLRVEPIPDRVVVLRRGADFIRRCHGEGRARIYLQTVTEGNRKAAALLSAGRLGMPRLKDLGGLHTFLLSPSVSRKLPNLLGYEVRAASRNDIPEVIAFLGGEGARQFFPCYRPEDFGPRGGLLKGLSAGDVLLLTRDGRLAGTLGLWDQEPCKQSFIAGYGPALNRMRPFYNLLARFRSRPGLPAAGATVRHLKAALLRIEGDDAGAFAVLLKHALWKARERSLPLAIMVHERDPFLPVLRALPSVAYASRLFAAYFEDGRELAESLDGLVPYVELGAL
ncbi:MAG: hypothetical protein JF616_08060 [Fibrobacteres bacterium]|nr:hypothetical protein [Fibrobacterota bacterium]